MSRVPISEVVGLADDDDFDLSSEILPTSMTIAVIEEYREEYNRVLAYRECPKCTGKKGYILMCDRQRDAWHPGCAELEELPIRF